VPAPNEYLDQVAGKVLVELDPHTGNGDISSRANAAP
jgi:hypothetical protein